MENRERKIINRRDAVIMVLIILAVCAGLIIPKLERAGGFAVVTCGDESVAEIPLDKDGDYGFPQLEGMVFTVAEGKISVVESDCGDGTCIRTGAISRSGEVIVCVPNKAAVTIYGKEQNDLDVVLK